MIRARYCWKELTTPSTWLRSEGDASLKPPHFLLDWFFWGSMLDLLGAAGYVAADALRGYFISQPYQADQLYMIVGAAFFVESLCFMISWRQATYNVGVWPHLATEFLNVVSCTMYFATGCMYQFEVLADSQDLTTIIYGNAVVFVEWLAAILFSFDAMLYWYVWCVDNLELEEVRSDVDPETARSKGWFRRYVWLMFRPRSCQNVEMQEHVWNVLPSFVYITASSVALYLQLSVFQGNMFGDPTYVYPPLPPPFAPPPVTVNASVCYPNVAYAPFTPPCSSPVLFNASCVLADENATHCWADVDYAVVSPGVGCGAPDVEAFCEQEGAWTPAPRNASRVVDGTLTCFRRGAYGSGDPCGAPGLWPGLNVSGETCEYAGLDGVPPPCNDPTLWFADPADAYYNVTDATPSVVDTTTLGQLASLRISAQIYLIGDTIYLWDAAVVLYAWWIYALDREREHREHVEKHGHHGGSEGHGKGGEDKDDDEEEEDEYGLAALVDGDKERDGGEGTRERRGARKGASGKRGGAGAEVELAPATRTRGRSRISFAEIFTNPLSARRAPQPPPASSGSSGGGILHQRAAAAGSPAALNSPPAQIALPREGPPRAPAASPGFRAPSDAPFAPLVADSAKQPPGPPAPAPPASDSAVVVLRWR